MSFARNLEEQKATRQLFLGFRSLFGTLEHRSVFLLNKGLALDELCA